MAKVDIKNEENKKQTIDINDNNDTVKTSEDTNNLNGEKTKDIKEDNKEMSIEEKMAATEAEKERLKDKYLRTVAEFDNYRKRTLKEKAELLLNGSEKTICAVLPILDDFERALDTKTEDANAIKEGMQLIFNKFKKTLSSLGVEKIETEGKDFDVDYHEAVAMVPGMGDDKKGKIIDCVQSGYKLNDKVIRHAKVAVGQ